MLTRISLVFPAVSVLAKTTVEKNTDKRFVARFRQLAADHGLGSVP